MPDISSRDSVKLEPEQEGRARDIVKAPPWLSDVGARVLRGGRED